MKILINMWRQCKVETVLYFLFALLVLAPPALAEDASRGTFPLLFDSRERLAKPDLSSLTRVRFLTTLDFPPFNFVDETGRPTGFQVDMIREICDELEIAAKCQIQGLPFEELRPALDRKEGDAIIAGISVTADLRQNYLFSRPFMALPARFARYGNQVLKGRAAEALAGKSVGVIGASAHEAMLKAYFPALKPVVFPDRKQLLDALKAGKVDAVYADGVQLAFWVAGPDAEKCCTLFDGPYFSEHFFGEGLSIMLGPDDDILQQAMDHALLTLSREGRLNELYLRYFPYGLY